ASGGIPSADWQLAAVVLVLLSLATTVPLGLLWAQPATAAVAVSAASVLSIGLFHMLTVAGLVVQLTVLYRLRPRRSPLRAAGLAAPCLALALPGRRGGEPAILTMLLASLAPAAAWAGFARRARTEAQAHRAAQQVITDTLLQNTARGERARISRELHDVVA